VLGRAGAAVADVDHQAVLQEVRLLRAGRRVGARVLVGVGAVLRAQRRRVGQRGSGRAAVPYDDRRARVRAGRQRRDTPETQTEPKGPYRFNAKRFDNSTGTYDMGFRDYNPTLNRFLTLDSYNGALDDLALGLDPWTANRYAFTGGNPINITELDGHAGCQPGDCPQREAGLRRLANNTTDKKLKNGVNSSKPPQAGHP
jgi:RHS repeat-associated protein